MHQIKIYGDIVPFGNYEDIFSIENLSTQLSNLSVTKGDDVVIGINTYGGDVDAGFSMYNIIRRFAKEKEVTITTRLDGYCASIGVVILLAGDKRVGNQYACPFVHNAWTLAVGDSNELQKIYLDLEKTNNRIAKFFSEKINIDFETAKQLMQDETWIEPAKALEYGFFTELENNETSAKAFYNLLKENNLLRNSNNINKNEKKMTIAQKVSEFMKNTFGAQNKILFDADNNEVDFYELEDGATPKIGDKANLKGAPADGEILMTTGETFVFDKGTVTEIKEKVSEDEQSMVALQSENADLKAQIDALKTNAIEATNKLTSATTFINSLKDFTSEINVNDDKKNQNNRNNGAKPSAFASAIKNVK